MSSLLDECLCLRARYDEEPSHSDQVAKLALALFDELRPVFALEDRDRELLHGAALLHDIGWSQTPDGKGHHKWSARLIKDRPWENLEVAEVEVVAQIARYHRKAIPKPDHDEFHALPAAGQNQVMMLGGILRIADALDRTHTAKVERLTVEVTRKSVLIRVKARGLWDAEREMVESKREMLEQATGRSVLCEKL